IPKSSAIRSSILDSAVGDRRYRNDSARAPRYENGSSERWIERSALDVKAPRAERPAHPSVFSWLPAFLIHVFHKFRRSIRRSLSHAAEKTSTARANNNREK